ncbi:MAG: asparagine synthase (glutamine-hydrolyzing) [Gloeotrichia echinulata GP01]|jgi:asparagine synthase (glutamine-hydrolysing)
MCGIAGFLSRTPLKEANLNFALKALFHRGPDNQGMWQDNYIQLGHTRLSILDLSPLGNQPMSYQDGRFMITFNGEIYNYIEIREELSEKGYSFISQTDTEVLIAAYAHWGTQCLDKLRGMFAFAIWDKITNKLFLARDRTGEKPLYYWFDDNKFYFTSELKALLTLLPKVPALDPIAIDLYLHYQYVPEPRTPLIGVYKLPAAHYLLINCEDWEIEPKRYWSLAQIQPIEGDPIKLIRQELDQVIDLTLRSDVPIGIALSGGLDSGGIAALAAPKYKNTLQALSIGYEGTPACDERAQAAELAQWLGLEFRDVELRTSELVDFFPDLVSAIDDPIADIAAYGHFAVTRLAADLGIKVLLNGLGGDELFWGYNWVLDALRLAENKYNLHSTLGKFQSSLTGLDWLTKFPLYNRLANSNKIPNCLRTTLDQGLEISNTAPWHPQQIPFYNVRVDFRYAWYHRQHLYTKVFLEQLPERNPYQPFVVSTESTDIPNQICQLVFDTWLVSNCLSLGDRTSMAWAVEARIPLLDYKLIELVMGMRKAQPDHEYGQKSWLRSALKNVLPDKVIQRKKRGFEPPYEEWIKALLEKYGKSVLEGYLVEMGFFNRKYIEKIFSNYRENYAMVYKLILLESWYKYVVLNKLL